MYQRKQLEPIRRVAFICDFCASPLPSWVYASSRMSTGEYRTCWRWAACNACASLIDGEEWDQLHNRVEVAFVKRFGWYLPKVVKAATAVALGDFYRYAIEDEDR
jgi:hypothetical protein